MWMLGGEEEPAKSPKKKGKGNRSERSEALRTENSALKAELAAIKAASKKREAAAAAKAAAAAVKAAKADVKAAAKAAVHANNSAAATSEAAAGGSPLAATGGSSPPAAQPKKVEARMDGEFKIMVGGILVVVGLVNQPEYNGRLARVVSHEPTRGVWNVFIEGEPKKVRPTTPKQRKANTPGVVQNTTKPRCTGLGMDASV